MAKVGEALKQVLEDYEISQYRLAAVMGIGRSAINNWVNGRNEPLASTVIDIRDALESMNPAAAEEFIRLYLEK
jgi:transcriptional regulator with XRE-family HTH domain